MNAPIEISLDTCPGPAALAAFDSGRLDDLTAELVAAHLETCSLCGDEMDRLQHEPPPGDLADRLRKGRVARPDPEASAVVRLRAATIDYPAEVVARRDPDTVSRAGAPTRTSAVEVGPYRILSVISRGGMGIVYRAEHLALKRPVAVKMIRDGAYAQPETLRRFRVEAEAVARLRHPNIVEVYDYSEYEGVPYLGMELVDGGTLAHRLAKGGPVPFLEAARLSATVARAVHYAHERKVLHRDLKPSNVLLEPGGAPKVADFGLAKLMDAETAADPLTHTDAVIGTPNYMAPEQASGRTAAIGPWTDVYAVGAILYELLTGRPPYKGESKVETLRLVWEADLAAPSAYREGIPPELEAVCRKCLVKLPAGRYATAELLAADLERWLDGQKTVARPPSRARLYLRRTRNHWLSAGCLLVVMAGGFGTRSKWSGDAEQAARAGELKRIEAELVAGKSVELIGREGLPRWYRWRSGEESSKLYADAKTGACTLIASGEARVELLPTLKPPYRITAELAPQAGRYAGEQSGLFFGASRLQRGLDAVEFSRMFGLANKAVPQMLVVGRPAGPAVAPERLPAAKVSTIVQHHPTDGPSVAMSWDASRMLRFEHVKPAWHLLELVVGPDSVQGSWDGEEFKGSMAKIGTNYEPNLAVWRSQAPDPVRFAALHDFVLPATTDGSLGLYVHWNTVSFRSLRVEPTPADPLPHPVK